ncbi:MAG: imidazole glycerol phosphate synthase subunit HisH [Cytophagales bacterium]|nr:imidazole glycerol phosphate synthase subunit HisH [Cytophagales bacterium]
MTVAVVKYNAGNVTSVINALNRLGVDSVLTDDPDVLRKADKVIFPGQGEASSAMKYLKSRGLDEVIKSLKQPFLGICLGLQLLCKHTEEGNTDCLGIFDVDVKRFPPMHKVPHMGWNHLTQMNSPLFDGLPAEPFFYYVHSYFAELGKETVARTDYISEFSAVLQKENFYAIQAHPEKSGEDGSLLLKNFLNF